MDALKNLLNQKKRQLNDIAIDSKGSKIIKMSDVYKKKEEEQAALKQAAKNQKLEEKHNTSKNNPSTSLSNQGDEDERQELARVEVVRRLRAHGVPILFFGETHKEAQKRLRKLEIEKPELKEGWKNDFQSAMDKVNEELMEEVIKGTSKDQASKLNVATPETDGQTWEQIMTNALLLETTIEPVRDCNIIYAFLTHILKRWGAELNARKEEVKRSPAGKLDATTHRQTMEHMKPLLVSLEKHTCDNNIRGHLGKIVKLCANSAYMEMAIGNAPWPVGVTRSGVHQRPGSAKAYVSNIAHVLNDETQRKYIHGLKRVLTKCQNFYPSDPSRSVDYVRPAE
ncbi:PRP18-like protein [Aphelenchoides bicaudatus]|nr:PRP18-like protein [Aphelenchoides bicaudatus]